MGKDRWQHKKNMETVSISMRDWSQHSCSPEFRFAEVCRDSLQSSHRRGTGHGNTVCGACART